MSNTLKGKIIHVGEIEQFTKSEKRTFVIETEDKYPQKIPFELWKDRVLLVVESNIGEVCTVHFDPQGRENNGKWFASLNCWKVEGLGTAAAAVDKVKTTPNANQFAETLKRAAAGTVTMQAVLSAFILTSSQAAELHEAIQIAANNNDLPF